LDAGEDTALRGAWAEGLTLGAIAARLVRSRNSTAGRVHRLGLPPRPSPIGQRAGPWCPSAERQ
jgi:GcrA cell cycle regulator